MKSVACALLAVGASAAQDCPGSPAPLFHASCKVVVNVGDSCAFIMSEIQCRVAGQPGHVPCTGYDGSPATWHDPHNNGTYTILGQTATELKLQRVTGNKKYTDKLNLVFTPVGVAGGCNVEGCSESQVTSYSDFSTNYCNLRMLYCADPGCKTALRGSMTTEISVSTGAGATHDPSKCIVTTEAPPPLVLSTTNAGILADTCVADGGFCDQDARDPTVQTCCSGLTCLKDRPQLPFTCVKYQEVAEATAATVVV